MASTQRESFDVAVIGGGAIGLAIAWRAAQRGLDVCVFDGDRARGACNVAAGMLAPVTEARLGERPLLDLGLESARRWPAFAKELAAATGEPLGYTRCGTLLLARDRDEVEALERERDVRLALGLQVHRLRPSEARALVPALAPGAVRLALAIADDHAVDPRRLVRALSAAAILAGASLRETDVSELICEHGKVSGVLLADRRELAAERVVVAAGAWSSRLRGFPDDAAVPVRPVKGQILRLRDPAGPGLLERVLRVEGAYLVPRGDGRYVLGATVEEQGFDETVTAGAMLELLREVDEVLPGLRELELTDFDAGLRPATPDNAPALGRGAIEGLFWATGHYRNGILLAPITADLLAAQLAGEAPEPVALPFAAQRFAGVHA